MGGMDSVATLSTKPIVQKVIDELGELHCTLRHRQASHAGMVETIL